MTFTNGEIKVQVMVLQIVDQFQQANEEKTNKGHIA